MIRNGGGRKVVDPKYWNEWWTTTGGPKILEWAHLQTKGTSSK